MPDLTKPHEDVLADTGVAPAERVLEVRDLRVHFDTPAGVVKAVDGVSWHVDEGETLAIVGESGSGKSVSAMTILGLVPSPPATFPSGQVLLEGRSLLDMPESQQRKLRGNDIAMIFQDPLTALNPVFRVGDQIAEMVRVHQKVAKRRPTRRPSTCSPRSGSRTRTPGPGSTRTSSPAGCGSAP